MRVLAALVRKELRDQRGLSLLAGGLFALVVVGARLVLGASFDAELRSQRILPFALGIVAAVLAAESIGRDASSGVESAWERLPVDRALVWGAKVAAVVAGALLFLGGALALELALRAVEPAPDSLYAVGLLPSARWLPLIPCATAFVLLWTAVLRSSLPAALVGVGCLAVVPLLGEHLGGRTAHLVARMVGHWSTSRWLGIGTLAAISGSLLAFHVGGWRRLALKRAAAAASGLVLVLGPALGRTAAVALAALHFGIFDPEARLTWVEPSPDGRHLAVLVRRDDPRPTETRAGILDRSTGEWLPLDDVPLLGKPGKGRRVWTRDGELTLVRIENPLRREGGLIQERIDPRTGRAVFRCSWTRDPRFPDESWCSRREEGDQLLLTWKGRSEELSIPKRAPLAVAAEPGIVFLAREGALVRRDLGSGEERELYRSTDPHYPAGGVNLSPDDRWIAIWESGCRVIVEVSTGRVVQRDLLGLLGWCREPGRVALVLNVETRETELLLEDGTRRVLGSGSARWVEDGPDGFLRWEDGGRRVERVGLEGEVLEVLYDPDRLRR